MISKKAGFAALAVLFFLICHNSCVDPSTSGSHPVIWVNTDILTFSASEAGPNPPAQVLQIKNSGIGGNLNYTIADDAPWLIVSPNTGSSVGQIVEHSVSVEKATLSPRPEAYTAVISITSFDACNSPRRVAITLSLSEQPPPEISVTPRDVSFSGAAGGSNPPAQTIRVRNNGQGTLNYTLTEDADWLSVTPSSGTSTGNEVIHSLSANITGLGTGTYMTVITIADSNAVNNPQVVNVTLMIGTTIPPAIDVSPSSLSFNAQVGGTNPATQRIRVRNSGGGTLDYALTSDVGWMSVTPSSGTSTGQEVSHAVSVNIAGLTTGTYAGLITVSSPNATNSPQGVQVTLVISAVPTGNWISISCNPTSGFTGNIIDVPITIYGNTNEIKAFGMDITVNHTMFSVLGINKGSLTGSWPFVSYSVTATGVRIGGFAGDPNLAIPPGSSGTIAVLRLQVTCSACTDGQQSQFCMGSFTDDIIGMTMGPGCATFTFRR